MPSTKKKILVPGKIRKNLPRIDLSLPPAGYERVSVVRTITSSDGTKRVERDGYMQPVMVIGPAPRRPSKPLSFRRGWTPP